MNAKPFDPFAPLPLLTADLPGTGGRIKAEPEDFEVEEIPAYQPSGTGEYLYLWIEKRAVGAEYFVRQVAHRLDVGIREVGTAGLKDRQAVTRQMVSVPARAEANLDRLDGDGIRLLSRSRHGNKLKAGHLHGNRFRILIRDVGPDSLPKAQAIIGRIAAVGLANFYGAQRFGRGGETLRLGLDLLHGVRTTIRNPFLRRLALSAAQSALFNHYLARRMADGLLRRVLPGDVMAKWPFGGLFVAQDIDREQARLDARETVPAGPIFGRKMFRAADDAARREQQVLQDAELSSEAFAKFGKLLPGTRRHSVIYIEDLAADLEADGLRLRFALPAGSYATVLLREFTRSEPSGTFEESS